MGAVTRGGAADYPWLNFAMATVGSIVIGLFCGAVISLAHSSLATSETLLIFFAIFILLGAAEKVLLASFGLYYSFLLTALTAGAVFVNMAIDPAKLERTLRTLAAPIFAGFFVMSGFELHLEALTHLGVGGILLIVVYTGMRTAGKFIGCKTGARWADAPETISRYLGPAMLCQAAVAIGLIDVLKRTWNHPLASSFATTVLGSVIVFEMMGPLLVKRCVVQCGEVKAATLMRRVGFVAPEISSVIGHLLNALKRLIMMAVPGKHRDATDMQVKHIMRTHFHPLPASATLDEVLHFVERSRFNDFPVADDENQLVGVIHFGELREMIYDPSMRELVTAVDLVNAATPAVPPDMPVRKLIKIFEKTDVGCLPVIDPQQGRRLLGIVEQRDLFRLLQLP